ncbi:hypothetical protein I4U23_002092 [Adineta vaga]|nr:hypothetical protein I4U23_002092 [Adineta vaga]
MASFSSTLNEEKTNNRSDPSKIYDIGQTSLARLRPEKLDDVTIKKQISIIQEVCKDIDPDLIALVHHECDYNIQNTISRIKAGDFEDGGWQTAKSNNKKKNHNNNHVVDSVSNGNTQNESERSLSQRASPTSLIRGNNNTAIGGRQRQETYQQSSTRTNTGRRGNDPGRNHSIPTNPRYPARTNYSNNTNINNKSLPIQENPSELIPASKQKEETTLPAATASSAISSADEYEFTDGPTQSLTFDNSQKLTNSFATTTKRPMPSSIPQQPVSMHPTVQFSTEPIDIQFGDVQWNDSIPMTITPSNSSVLVKSLDDHEHQLDVQNSLSSSYNNRQAMNEIDRELNEITNRLSTSSISNNNASNNATSVPVEGTSHLSDHLTESLRQQQASLQDPSSSSSVTDPTHLPPTSTPNTAEYTTLSAQTNNPFVSNESNDSGGNPSAFTPYNTASAFQPIAGEYSQTASNWNQQPSLYKTASKSNMIQPGSYPQQASYQLPPQQFFVGTYPYTPTLYPVIATSVDSWPSAGFEPYPTYQPANYIPTYPTQQAYQSASMQPTKYDQYSYDKEVHTHYGQASNSPQSSKDPLIASKLSANAATFPQGAPLAATSPTTAFLINPFLYTVPTYYTSHQDRSMTYPSIDNRNNRTGASYSGNNNRNLYHHQQQQQQQQQPRTPHNSTWHSQQ